MEAKVSPSVEELIKLYIDLDIKMYVGPGDDLLELTCLTAKSFAKTRETCCGGPRWEDSLILFRSLMSLQNGLQLH